MAGIVISLVQIVTSIQDSAFSTIPRLVAFLRRLLLLHALDAAERSWPTRWPFWGTWAAMPAERHALSSATLYGFLLVLARVSGVFVFVPIPGLRRTLRRPARVVLSLALTLALYPQLAGVDAGRDRLRPSRRPGCWRKPPSGSRSAWRWRF